MKLRLTNNLQRYEWFWKARGILLRHIDFPVNSFLWKVGYKKDNFKESSSIFIRSIQSVLSTLVLAALILLLVNLPKLFFNHIPIAGEGVSTIISTIVTVAGIVIGLYYAGLTSAAGGLFMKAPKSLQDVFLSEKEGGHYRNGAILPMCSGATQYANINYRSTCYNDIRCLLGHAHSLDWATIILFYPSN